MDPSSLPGWGERPERVVLRSSRGTDAVPDSSAFETVGSRFAAVAAAHLTTALVAAGESGDPTTMSWAELSSRAAPLRRDSPSSWHAWSHRDPRTRPRSGGCTAHGAALAGSGSRPCRVPNLTRRWRACAPAASTPRRRTGRPARGTGRDPGDRFDELAVTGDRPDAGPRRGGDAAPTVPINPPPARPVRPRSPPLSHRRRSAPRRLTFAGAGAADEKWWS